MSRWLISRCVCDRCGMVIQGPDSTPPSGWTAIETHVPMGNSQAHSLKDLCRACTIIVSGVIERPVSGESWPHES